MTIVLNLPSLFPPWFLGVSAGIELFCAVIAFAICFIGYRSYKYLKDSKLIYFSLGFFLISLSLFAHALLNLAINFGLLNNILGTATRMGITYLLGIYYLLIIGVMLAYMSFIVIYSKTTRLGSALMFYLLTLIIGILSFNSYFKINLISGILAGIIVYYTGINYFRKKQTNARLVFSAFVSIALFHFMFVLEHFHTMFYNIKYIVLALGFVFFLIALLRVYHGSRKKK